MRREKVNDADVTEATLNLNSLHFKHLFRMKAFILAVVCVCGFAAGSEDERLPNKCEVCKLLTMELEEALEKTGRSKEVLEVGEVLDTGKRRRKIKYNTSETRLTEAVDNICERILQYSVHAERPGSLRYAKGSSQTMTTLKNLVNKGVKVDLGMPYELWDEPSAEVTNMKKQVRRRTPPFPTAAKGKRLSKRCFLFKQSVFCAISARRCWSSTRTWWRIGTSTIRTGGWRTSSVRTTS
uniref:DUF3456 domain-containing protein n=1 Tax=Poecilia mexicana TaxID=48701 RepID=A0A3B3XB93_9TELE